MLRASLSIQPFLYTVHALTTTRSVDQCIFIICNSIIYAPRCVCLARSILSETSHLFNGEKTDSSRVSNISRFFPQQIITDFIEIEESELGKISKILASTRLFYILSSYSIHGLFPRSIKEIMYLIR